MKILNKLYMIFLLISKIETRDITLESRVLSEFKINPRLAVAKFNKLKTQDDIPKPQGKTSKEQRIPETLGNIRISKSLELWKKSGDDPGFQVGGMAWEALKKNVKGCHFLLLTQDVHRSFVDEVIRLSFDVFQPLVLIDVKRHQNSESGNLQRAIWGEDNNVCIAVLIDLTFDDDENMLSFLRSHELTIWPEAWVIVVGGISKVKVTLYHEVFRNTLQPIFLGLKDLTLNKMRPRVVKFGQILKPAPGSNLPGAVKQGDEDTLPVYSRCLYCNEGDPQVRFLFLWPLGSKLPSNLNPFPDQHLDTQGHQFRIVSMASFPYNNYIRDSDEPSSTVTQLDSMDKRLLLTVSDHVNFTYDIRAPWDNAWGVPTPTGNYTGLVGTIQYNKADFTTTIAPTPSRNVIIDVAKAYTSDVLSVVSLKPQLLPQYLVIVRPFSVGVWMLVVLFTMVWGFALWLLQKIHFQYSKGDLMTLSRAIFYSWAVFLEDPPPKPPKNVTGQILVGFWLLACLVITTGFRASLVSHLAVQLKTKPIDSFRDLVERGDFQWGMEASYLTGVSRIYFETSTDPVVKEIYRSLEHIPSHDEAFASVSGGSYGYVVFNKLAFTLIYSYYMDDFGNTPYYISKQGQSMVPYFGWGCGKGAPFRVRFDMVMTRLNEAGIIDYWLDDVMAKKVRENRKELKSKIGNKTETKVKIGEDSNTVKLRMVHMTGVFLVLFLGFSSSCVALVVERFVMLLGLSK